MRDAHDSISSADLAESNLDEAPLYGPIDEMLAAALDHAQHGRPVVPCWWPTWSADGCVSCACQDPACKSLSKHPLTARGFLDATRDRQQVVAWWRRVAK